MSNFRQLTINPTPGARQNPPAVPTVYCPPELHNLIRVVVADVIGITERNVNASPHMQYLYLLLTNGGMSWGTPEFAEAVQKCIAYLADSFFEKKQIPEQNVRLQYVEWVLTSIAALEVQQNHQLQQDVARYPEWQRAVQQRLTHWGSQNGTKARIDRALAQMHSMGLQPIQGNMPFMGAPPQQANPYGAYGGGGYGGAPVGPSAGYGPGPGYAGGYPGAQNPGYHPGYSGGYPNPAHMHGHPGGGGYHNYPAYQQHYPQYGHPGGMQHPAPGRGPGPGAVHSGGMSRSFDQGSVPNDSPDFNTGNAGFHSSRIVDDEDGEDSH